MVLRHQYTAIQSQLQNMELAFQLAVKEASIKHVLQVLYTGFINTNLDIGWRCSFCEEKIDETVKADAFVLLKHYLACVRMNSNTNDIKLYNNDGQAYDDSVMEFLIELFSVLNKTTDCVSYSCQAHACAVATRLVTRANINTSNCMYSLKAGFVATQRAKPMVKAILRRAASNHPGNNLNLKYVLSTNWNSQIN